MLKKKYSFKVHVNPYSDEPSKQSLRYIDVSRVTLVTKNSTVGMLGFATPVCKKQGHFLKVSGDCNGATLKPSPRGVTMIVRGFPTYPKLFNHDRVDDGTVSISDIEEIIT